MLRSFLRLLGVLVVISAALGGMTDTLADSPSSEAAATLTLQLLNEWRISEGLAPLRANATLNEMALQQANFVLGRIDSIVDEAAYHKDLNGRDAIRRAREMFGWPSYGRPERVEVGENAAEFNVKRAIQFWRESPIHRKAAISKAYREVGVAALQYKNRYLIYTVFGARPNVFPVLVSRDRGKIYLTNEYSRYADVSPDRVSVTVLGMNNQPIVTPQPWKAVIAAPPNLPDRFIVKYVFNDGESIIEQQTEVNTATDEVILPGSGMTLSTQVALAPTPAPQPTFTPTAPPTPFVIMLATNTPRSPSTAPAVPTNTPPVIVVIAPTATPLPPTLPPPTAVPPTAAPSSRAALLILYDSTTLTVINVSGKTISITGLVVSRTGVERWQALAPFPSSRFGAGNCLQMVVMGKVASIVPVCNYIRSELQIDAARQFWVQAPFPILLNGQVIATCQPNAGRCEVDLP